MKIFKWALLALPLVFLTSCKNDKDDDSDVVSQKFIHKYGFDMSENEWETREKEGKSITVLENGVTVTKTFNADILHGPTTYTFPNSSVIAQVDLFDEGTLIKQTFHDENGMPYKEESFEPGENTTITLWDKFGVPISVEQYQEGNLANGKYYKPDNDLEASIQSGNGIRMKRDRNGELLYKDVFEYGKLKNRTTYHPNGQVQSTMSFDDYDLHGEQITYSPSGTIVMRAEWDHGQLDGIKTAYRNGNKIMEIPYHNGKKNGVEKHWDDNGRLAAEIHWDNDKKHGSHREYKDEDTEIKWYYKGKNVSMKKFEEFSHREHLVVDKESFHDMINKLDEKEALKD
ncbi:MAG: toxin-antitoxin system YwqK family antitoxin [Parachlamydiales bacterium]|nr:toxin-antitoxin system YwqK family antitoxin [Parachlamydiales bacterium]